MAFSNEWTEWYLTSEGWISGSAQTDFNNIINVPKPSNTMLVRRYRECMSSSFSKNNISVDDLWSCEEPKVVDDLIIKYPFPNHL